LKFGWLVEHRTSVQEITDLLAVADRDLEASRTPGLVTDWRFAISYNAALQLATAALAAAGFKAERANHHYRTLQTLEFTIGLGQKDLRKLDLFRKKRNVADYERIDGVSEWEADQMREIAAKLRSDVEDWILKNHPEFR
jgi:hypothetical protein